MSAEVRVLDTETVNRIAAGEVVESARSVVKELVENSLDAGATRVEVDVEGGGMRLVRVVDDGGGMDEQNALLALERHATSKLSSAHDLHSIRSLGFRGEAVPAIAAVSRMTLVTRPPEADSGTRIEVNGGRLDRVERAATPPGTRIEVRHLFFNTPARRKFQRSPGAELSAIRELMTDYLLARPDVAFRLRSNRDTLLATPGGLGLCEALERVLAPGEVGHFVEMEARTHPTLPYQVGGFLARPELSRANSRGVRLFVNGRPFYSALLCRTLLDACRNFLPRRRWPAAVLMVEADPRAVDVNVHPAKREVRFTGFEKLQEWMVERVRATLELHAEPRSVALGAVMGEEPEEAEPAATPARGEGDQHGPETARAVGPPEDPVTAGPLASPAPAPAPAPGPAKGGSATPRYPRAGELARGEVGRAVALFDPAPYRDLGREAPDLVGEAAAGSLATAPGGGTAADSAGAARPPEPGGLTDEEGIVRGRLFPGGVRVLGQVFRSFLVIADDEKLYYVDQHVAHERVLFEHFSEKLRSDEPTVQNLLIPQELTLSPARVHALAENPGAVERYGFRLRVEGEQVLVEAFPLFPREVPVMQVLADLVDGLAEVLAGTPVDEEIEAMADMMSCKAAIKAGERMSRGEMVSLLRRLSDCQYPLTCPHGRPVLLSVGEDELRRRFLRTD